MAERVFSGRLITVELEGLYEIVRHPPAAAVVALDAEGRTVLVRQRRPAVGEDLWEIPAGLRGPGEPPEDAAVRELAEEAGLRPGRLERLAGFYTSPGFTDEWLDVFLATDLVPVPEAERGRDGGEEIDEVDRVPLAEALVMVRDGRIRNATSVAGLLLAAAQSPK